MLRKGSPYAISTSMPSTIKVSICHKQKKKKKKKKPYRPSCMIIYASQFQNSPGKIVCFTHAKLNRFPEMNRRSEC